jgi:Ran GTPase-activating protein (RanGAP) involved in mRNA processing and transport
MSWNDPQMHDIVKHHLAPLLSTSKQHLLKLRLVCRNFRRLAQLDAMILPLPHQANQLKIQPSLFSLVRGIILRAKGPEMALRMMKDFASLMMTNDVNIDQVSLYCQTWNLECAKEFADLLTSPSSARITSLSLLRPIAKLVTPILEVLPLHSALSSLSVTALTLPSADLLARLIETSTVLKHLSILMKDAPGLEIVTNALKASKSINTFCCCWQYASSRADVMKDVLAHNTSITHLDLSQAYLGNTIFTNLVTGLASNTTLRSLILENTYPSTRGVKILVDALKTNQTLTELSMKKCKMGQRAIEALAGGVASNRTLQKLHLSGNRGMGTAGFQAMTNAVARCNTLRSLTMGSCYFHKCKIPVSDVISTGRSLTFLDLGNLYSNDAPLEKLELDQLAEALAGNTALTKLDLSSFDIGNHGVKGLGTALERNTTLRSLILDEARIRDNGAEALAQSLWNNSTLTELSLVGNKIEDTGALFLAQAVENRAQLTLIDLRDNRISLKAAKVHPLSLPTLRYGLYDVSSDDDLGNRDQNASNSNEYGAWSSSDENSSSESYLVDQSDSSDISTSAESDYASDSDLDSNLNTDSDSDISGSSDSSSFDSGSSTDSSDTHYESDTDGSSE